MKNKKKKSNGEKNNTEKISKTSMTHKSNTHVLFPSILFLDYAIARHCRHGFGANILYYSKVLKYVGFIYIRVKKLFFI